MSNIWKKVIIFEHKEYQWFIPKRKWIIKMETENWVLVSTRFFQTIFAMKNKKDAWYYCWYIELSTEHSSP